MAKPDPALLDPARYPFRTEIVPRFGDLDPNNHINNVALMGILEESRVRFHRASGYFTQHTDSSSMIVSMTIEFLGQGFYPDPLEIYLATDRIGRSSHTINQLAFQSGRIVCFAQSTIVSVRDGRPAPIPADNLAQVEAWKLKL